MLLRLYLIYFICKEQVLIHASSFVRIQEAILFLFCFTFYINALPVSATCADSAFAEVAILDGTLGHVQDK